MRRRGGWRNWSARMANKTLNLDKDLYDYLLAVSLREPQVLKELREATEREDMSVMRSAPEQGQFMALLLRLMQAKKVLEIGTYTGYATLWMALALPQDGEIITCDISRDWTSVARRFWAAAHVQEKIHLHLRPALETLDELIAHGGASSFDFAFIDADKENYAAYYEQCLTLLRPGGLIVVDNTLWGGKVADMRHRGRDTGAIRAFNECLRDDARIDVSMLPVADGLTLAVKRPA